jgi:hypothetical protein
MVPLKGLKPGDLFVLSLESDRAAILMCLDPQTAPGGNIPCVKLNDGSWHNLLPDTSVYPVEGTLTYHLAE